MTARLAITAGAAVLGLGAGPGLCQPASSADYRLTAATAANGGGASVSNSTDYALRPGSAEGTTAGRASSADYVLKTGLVPQTVGGRCPEFEAWQILHFGSTTAPTAAPLEDPDGDGVKNLVEFALQTLPIGPGATTGGGAPTLEILGSNQFLVTYRRVETCLVYELETSTDLVGPWQPADPIAAIATTHLGNGTEKAVLNFLLPPHPQRFVRMRISLP